ncbi:MAG: cell wall hydrolase [Eubacteriales bacterium]|nr:cell wall hydrolase [Eubacteriales bacterium]MDD3198735.1 cell wall hydrolase [Eubacteriales bacterium]MDD4121570.1 cell wall hydrolase [Eubacteriales bacterium]MDD4629019.1 cell wall hydrolase [Eubacteriales bacterium]
MPFEQFDTRELFARLIQCEAGGEGDAGMRAVATVIMNRVNIPYGEFARVSQGGNLRNILEHERQFVCMRTEIEGVYNPQNVTNMNPTEVHYAIVDWAMAGNRLPGVDHSLFFFNPYSPQCPPYFPTNVGVIHNRVGDHCFYIPTQYYPNT